MKKPNKTYGQNWLTSPQAVAKIVETAEIKKTDIILEIGPGTGLLTKNLLATGAKIIAIEKDPSLITNLEETFKNELASGQLKLILGDFLELSPTVFPKKYKVVANIPYYITGQIIRQLLENINQPESAVLLVQKEVAKRIVGENNKESLLSLSVKAYGEPKYIQTIKAGSFYPKPKVDSAILKIDNISKQFFKNMDEKTFFEMIKAGFAQKRKLAKNNLGLNGEDLVNCGSPENARSEDISLSQWQSLYKYYANKK